jgi:hypothetical protein
MLRYWIAKCYLSVVCYFNIVYKIRPMLAYKCDHLNVGRKDFVNNSRLRGSTSNKLKDFRLARIMHRNDV